GLNHNKLTGTILIEFSQLTSLTILDLHQNQLTGTIPIELSHLTSLIHLRLYNNSLTGTIPTELGQLTSLRTLDLNQNQLTGTIPIELSQLTSLTSLDLHQNQLTGTIPIELSQLTSLTYLGLHGNALTGTVPIEVSQLTSLTFLGLDNIALTGTIPTELLSSNPNNRPITSEVLQHSWFTRTASVIRDECTPMTPENNAHDAAQTTIPTLATNHMPIQMPLQKLRSPNNSAIKDLSGAPVPADKAQHNSDSNGASSSARVEKSTKYEPCKSYASTLSASSNPEMNEEHEVSAMCVETGKVLGKGSFGIVYAATYNHCQVAVKCLHGVDTPAACKAFENEARQWLRLKHSCIVPLLGISYFDKTQVNSMGSAEAKPMLVMERMSTSVYSAIYDNSPPTVEKRLLWLHQTASAFSYLHHECKPPVLHLDLKPDNILIDYSGNARLADFGLARIQSLTNSYTMNSLQPKNHGAYLYAPPEAFEMRYKPTTKHDVYSFAMTAYEILFLQAPFSEEHSRVYAKDWVKRGDRPDRPSGTSIPDCCWKLIEDCWKQDATLRPDFIQS
ncbi:Receptor-interacting serine/threonine-protein kinase 4, partial [Chytriomyces hyalinus]